MPALRDVLGSHAQADPRSYFVASDGRGEKLLAGHAGPYFAERDESRKHDGAHMQHPGAMHVVQLEALHLRAVHKRSVGRRELFSRSPYGAVSRGVDLV